MGDVLEDHKASRSIWAWIILAGVYALLSGSILVPLLLDRTAGMTRRLGFGIPLSMIGILLLLRLTPEILEYRSRRSRE